MLRYRSGVLALHHVVLEQWSRGRSSIHRRDPRIKFVLLLVFLAAVATAPQGAWRLGLAYAACLCAATLAARLPLLRVLLRSATVLPFSATFAAGSWLGGDAVRAAALLAKSVLSAWAVLWLLGSTPLPALLDGLERMGVPRPLTLVVQFLYRYLFVISEQAQHMRLAAASRGVGPARRNWTRFRAAAGAVAVLFSRSHGRAEGIHRAMLARGFEGRIPVLRRPQVSMPDLLLLAGGSLCLVGLRWGAAAW